MGRKAGVKWTAAEREQRRAKRALTATYAVTKPAKSGGSIVYHVSKCPCATSHLDAIGGTE